MQNFVPIGLRVSAPQIRDFAVPFDVTSFYVRLFGFFNKAIQPTPLNRFLRKIHQKMSFRVKKCLGGVTMTIVNI